MILTPLKKLPKNGEDCGKLIVAKGFKRLPKVQNIAQSGHIESESQCCYSIYYVDILSFIYTRLMQTKDIKALWDRSYVFFVTPFSMKYTTSQLRNDLNVGV